MIYNAIKILISAMLILTSGFSAANWPQTSMNSEHYQVITLTPDMPVPGSADNDPQTQGIRLIGLRPKVSGSSEYVEVTRQFSPGATKHISYKGRKYRVVGDIHRVDELSDSGKWDKGQSVVVEEYYEILDSRGKRTGKGFLFSRRGE
ncbi:hypothetical protein AYY17_16670 [Morganella psychrotolerans]|uniref:Uncharacterized protein n=2 Tax=Morganella psychrotolerans TaxID=368603 RepID=A0A1B8HLT3_9GAMM|nr:hypothetical protein AYY17_16670 [Morganella psychrotolerans]